MAYPRQTSAQPLRPALDRRLNLPTAPGPLPRAVPLTRRYDVTALDVNGTLAERNVVAPASAVFEEAFAGFARGTLISTTEGPVAVEDLFPGMQIITSDNGPMPLLWVGSITVFPNLPELTEESVRLVRVNSESFGIGRPMPDLMLGPRARVLYRHERCREDFGVPAAFAPAHAFVDGEAMIEVHPVSPVRAYHIALDGQQVVQANGLEVESYHPGPNVDDMLDAQMLDLFLNLFPHVRSVHEFGPMTYPRLSAAETERMRNGY